MKINKETKMRFTGYHVAAVVFILSFIFFQFAYPYHLIRREQMNLFLYDWHYIIQTYRGIGWLSRFLSSFVEQFFRLPVVGPVVVALILTGIGNVSYRICRKFFSRNLSLGVASLIFVWSFLRETGNLFVTRYSIVFLAYLSLILLALHFRKVWSRLAALVVCAAVGFWALGSPFNHIYGKAWGVPRVNYDRVVGLDAEVSRENWDRVIKLSGKDLHMVEASFCYNLAHAMKGDLGDKFFDHSQSDYSNFLLPVSGTQSMFTNCLAGELWFHLGEMTIAEQSAITSLQSSPEHTGSRYVKRLASVNLIKGEEAAAQKYLNLLSKSLFYGKWARSMFPENRDAATEMQLQEARSKLAQTDFVHLSDVPRSVLLGILETDPDNATARNYLLCFDLLIYDLDKFMADYDYDRINARIYNEAVLIYLSQNGLFSEEKAAEYGISTATINKMDMFFRYPEKYKNTYWYYYLKALNESEK